MNSESDLVTTSLTGDLVRGALELEPTGRGVLPHRLPAWARTQIPDDQLAMAESQPSGVRLEFRTTARVIELDVVPTKQAYLGAPPRPDGIYDLVVDGSLVERATASGGDLRTIDMTTGTMSLSRGEASTLRFADLADGEKDIEIWLPHNETTELVALRTDAPVEIRSRANSKVWLHHGSSISHGSDAESPTTTWPAVAAARAGVDLLNLGFAGSAMLDAFTARTIRDTPADRISIKLGINVVNGDVMRVRAFGPAVHGFLDTIREGHPTTPLLVVSPILCPIHEDTPGPTMPDFSKLGEGQLSFVATGDPEDPTRLTLSTIRDQLRSIVDARAVDDPNLHYLDGRELYGETDVVELPLPDRLHPDTATHRLIGGRFAELAFGPNGGLADR